GNQQRWPDIRTLPSLPRLLFCPQLQGHSSTIPAAPTRLEGTQAIVNQGRCAHLSAQRCRRRSQICNWVRADDPIDEGIGVPGLDARLRHGPSSGIGGELTSNPTARKLTFTGSTEVGKLLMEQCAGTVKKLSLGLGGNASFIVFDD